MGGGLSFGGDTFQGGDGAVGVDAAIDHDGHGFAGVLVDDVQQLEDPAVDGDVELEVQRLHLIRMGGAEPLGGHRRNSEPSLLAGLGRYPEALFAPQPLDLLAVHRPPVVSQHRPGAAVPPTGTGSGELPQTRPQRIVAAVTDRCIALGGAVLTGDAARSPFRTAEPLLEHMHGSAAGRRAHQFPRAISLRPSISRAWSATIRFSRLSSLSSSRSRLASSAFSRRTGSAIGDGSAPRSPEPSPSPGWPGPQSAADRLPGACG